MKRLVPKAHLKWREPREIRRIQERIEAEARSFWFAPGMVVFASAPFLAMWWLARQVPGRTPPPLPQALGLALLAGVFFAYVLPWVLRRCPADIRVFENGISRVVGNTAAMWKFTDMERCGIAVRDIGGRAFAVLDIHLRNGRRILLGLPADLAAPAEDMLRRFNVPIDDPRLPAEDGLAPLEAGAAESRRPEGRNE